MAQPPKNLKEELAGRRSVRGETPGPAQWREQPKPAVDPYRTTPHLQRDYLAKSDSDDLDIEEIDASDHIVSGASTPKEAFKDTDSVTTASTDVSRASSPAPDSPRSAASTRFFHQGRGQGRVAAAEVYDTAEAYKVLSSMPQEKRSQFGIEETPYGTGLIFSMEKGEKFSINKDDLYRNGQKVSMTPTISQELGWFLNGIKIAQQEVVPAPSVEQDAHLERISKAEAEAEGVAKVEAQLQAQLQAQKLAQETSTRKAQAERTQEERGRADMARSESETRSVQRQKASQEEALEMSRRLQREEAAAIAEIRNLFAELDKLQQTYPGSSPLDEVSDVVNGKGFSLKTERFGRRSDSYVGDNRYEFQIFGNGVFTGNRAQLSGLDTRDLKDLKAAAQGAVNNAKKEHATVSKGFFDLLSKLPEGAVEKVNNSGTIGFAVEYGAHKFEVFEDHIELKSGSPRDFGAALEQSYGDFNNFLAGYQEMAREEVTRKAAAQEYARQIKEAPRPSQQPVTPPTPPAEVKERAEERQRLAEARKQRLQEEAAKKQRAQEENATTLRANGSDLFKKLKGTDPKHLEFLEIEAIKDDKGNAIGFAFTENQVKYQVLASGEMLVNGQPAKDSAYKAVADVVVGQVTQQEEIATKEKAAAVQAARRAEITAKVAVAQAAMVGQQLYQVVNTLPYKRELELDGPGQGFKFQDALGGDTNRNIQVLANGTVSIDGTPLDKMENPAAAMAQIKALSTEIQQLETQRRAEEKRAKEEEKARKADERRLGSTPADILSRAQELAEVARQKAEREAKDKEEQTEKLKEVAQKLAAERRAYEVKREVEARYKDFAKEGIYTRALNAYRQHFSSDIKAPLSETQLKTVVEGKIAAIGKAIRWKMEDGNYLEGFLFSGRRFDAGAETKYSFSSVSYVMFSDGSIRKNVEKRMDSKMYEDNHVEEVTGGEIVNEIPPELESLIGQVEEEVKKSVERYEEYQDMAGVGDLFGDDEDWLVADEAVVETDLALPAAEVLTAAPTITSPATDPVLESRSVATASPAINIAAQDENRRLATAGIQEVFGNTGRAKAALATGDAATPSVEPVVAPLVVPTLSEPPVETGAAAREERAVIGSREAGIAPVDAAGQPNVGDDGERLEGVVKMLMTQQEREAIKIQSAFRGHQVIDKADSNPQIISDAESVNSAALTESGVGGDLSLGDEMSEGSEDLEGERDGADTARDFDDSELDFGDVENGVDFERQRQVEMFKKVMGALHDDNGNLKSNAAIQVLLRGESFSLVMKDFPYFNSFTNFSNLLDTYTQDRDGTKANKFITDCRGAFENPDILEEELLEVVEGARLGIEGEAKEAEDMGVSRGATSDIEENAARSKRINQFKEVKQHLFDEGNDGVRSNVHDIIDSTARSLIDNLEFSSSLKAFTDAIYVNANEDNYDQSKLDTFFKTCAVAFEDANKSDVEVSEVVNQATAIMEGREVTTSPPSQDNSSSVDPITPPPVDTTTFPGETSRAAASAAFKLLKDQLYKKGDDDKFVAKSGEELSEVLKTAGFTTQKAKDPVLAAFCDVLEANKDKADLIGKLVDEGSKVVEMDVGENDALISMIKALPAALQTQSQAATSAIAPADDEEEKKKAGKAPDPVDFNKMLAVRGAVAAALLVGGGPLGPFLAIAWLVMSKGMGSSKGKSEDELRDEYDAKQEEFVKNMESAGYGKDKTGLDLASMMSGGADTELPPSQTAEAKEAAKKAAEEAADKAAAAAQVVPTVTAPPPAQVYTADGQVVSTTAPVPEHITGPVREATADPVGENEEESKAEYPEAAVDPDQVVEEVAEEGVTPAAAAPDAPDPVMPVQENTRAKELAKAMAGRFERHNVKFADDSRIDVTATRLQNKTPQGSHEI